jgi:hypothetical protein
MSVDKTDVILALDQLLLTIGESIHAFMGELELKRQLTDISGKLLVFEKDISLYFDDGGKQNAGAILGLDIRDIIALRSSFKMESGHLSFPFYDRHGLLLYHNYLATRATKQLLWKWDQSNQDWHTFFTVLENFFFSMLLIHQRKSILFNV